MLKFLHLNDRTIGMSDLYYTYHKEHKTVTCIHQETVIPEYKINRNC